MVPGSLIDSIILLGRPRVEISMPPNLIFRTIYECRNYAAEKISTYSTYSISFKHINQEC